MDSQVLDFPAAQTSPDTGRSVSGDAYRETAASLEALSRLAMETGYCSACFSGKYPTAIPQNTAKDRFEQKLHI